MKHGTTWISAVSALLLVPLCFAQSPDYGELIRNGYRLLQEQKQKAAYVTAEKAIQADPKRFEAYALAALALHQQHANAKAKTFADKALTLAPQEKKQKVQELATMIANALKTPAQAPPIALDPEVRRKMDVLQLIVEEADKAATTEERTGLLKEFLEKSAPFLQTNPEQANIWLLRAAAALELDEPQVGWEAGRKALELGQDRSDDSRTRKVMAMLDRKGWLAEQAPASKEESLEQQRAAISGIWKCFTPGSAPGERYAYPAYTSYTTYDYSRGMFTIKSRYPGRDQAYSTDGRVITSRNSTCTTETQYFWNALALNSESTIRCGSSDLTPSKTTSRKYLKGGILILESENAFDGKVRQGGSQCERITLTQLVTETEPAESANAAFFDFLGRNVLYARDLSLRGCTLEWTELAAQETIRRSTTLNFGQPNITNQLNSLSQPVFGLGKPHDPVVHFRTQALAAQAQQLWTAAAGSCQVLY